MTLAYLALGSNLGDRQANLDRALTLLEDHPGILPVATSSYYETEPLPVSLSITGTAGSETKTLPQEWFLNAVTVIKTQLSPAELLETCLEIEKELGRVRDPLTRWGPRILDIDILFYGDEIVTLDQPSLTIPHPRLHERAFVLVPMLEVQPELRHPVLDKTISELHLALEEPGEVNLYGQRSD